MKRELDRYATLFDTIERSPLTREQRIAAVTMANRNLLVAAAGSGKTSTMVGKVAYAIRSGMCTAEQILVLAFNRKAAHELDVRLRKSLAPFAPGGCRVTANTLHALGLDIVTRARGGRPHVQPDETPVLNRVLMQLVHHDIDFAERWLLFRVFYHVDVRHPDQFETPGQWQGFVRQHGERRNRHYGFVTLRDELVPTQFEQAIANWLFLHRIEYVYTDLTLRFSLTRLFQSVSRFPLAGRSGFLLTAFNRYLVCVDQIKPTQAFRLPVTYASLAEFRSGCIFTSLRQQLGIRPAIVPGSMSGVLTQLGHRLTLGQTEFLARFVRIARMNRIEPDVLPSRVSDSPDPVRASLHAPMLARLLSAYEAALDDTDAIDFDGMLHQAADCLDSGHYKHPYTLILVDEFQDTSQAGLRLLKSLLAQNRHCTLFAVGDDWQSIYRFAGAVPDVLSRFEHHFGKAAVNHLTATFRFNQSIADMASDFVQRNPAQLRKRVCARPAGPGASAFLAWYATTAHMFTLCEMCLTDSVSTTGCVPVSAGDTTDTRVSVYILGRYQHQKPPQLTRWQRQFTALDIRYQTVHSAKGLEADIVIVLGLHEGRHGFPARVPDDPLISLVMPPAEAFNDAEERRLFYVAITRCRHRLYLLASLQQPSCFVTELMGRVRDAAATSRPDPGDDGGSEVSRVSGESVWQRLC